MLNGGTQSDSERSLSQRTSPTSSLRGGAGSRYPSRPNPNRRGKIIFLIYYPKTSILHFR